MQNSHLVIHLLVFNMIFKLLKTSYAQLTLDFKNGISRVPKLLSFLFGEMDVGDPQDATPAKLSWQAQEDFATIDAVEALC